MRPRIDPPEALLALADHQAGVISRDQCLRLRVSPKALVRWINQYWHTVAPGVYLVDGRLRDGLPADWEALAWAGILAGDDGAKLGGSAAAHLWGLAGPGEPPRRLLVWTPGRRVVQKGFQFRRDVLGRQAVGALPRTTVEDTVLDLVEGAEPDPMNRLIADAVSSRRTTEQRLASALARRPRYQGRRLLAEMIGVVESGAHSPLERRFAKLLADHGLPAGVRQRRLKGRRVDVMLEEWGVVIELDGRQHHRGAAALRDLDRDNDHATRGLITLRYGWVDVTARHCEVAHQVAAVLYARGWLGQLQPCPGCALAA